MVCDKREFAAAEVGCKMFHAPDGSLHLEQERGVIAFVLLQLSAGIGNYTMFAVWINLCQDSSEAARLFVVAEASINNEGIGSVFSGVIDDRLRAKVGLQFLERLQGVRRQRATLPRAIFLRESCERGG